MFVQTNKPLGNTVVVYDRNSNGSLKLAGEFQTGGLGGATVGPPVDALASQHSLVFHDDCLFAVNAGSNTVTLFRVDGDHLKRLQVIWSGGLLPVSVTVHDNLVYALNAGGAGAVQGYQLHEGKLIPIKGANPSLGLNNANPPAFATAPAQIGISPNGRFVLVTTKTLNIIDSFAIDRDGELARHPVANTNEGGPFGFTFETTINNPGDFAINKGLTNLPAMRKVSFHANRCLLHAEHLSHEPAADADAFTAVTAPTTDRGQQIPGLRFGDPRAQALLAVLLIFRLQPNGFTNADLRHHVTGTGTGTGTGMLGVDPPSTA